MQGVLCGLNVAGDVNGASRHEDARTAQQRFRTPNPLTGWDAIKPSDRFRTSRATGLEGNAARLGHQRPVRNPRQEVRRSTQEGGGALALFYLNGIAVDGARDTLDAPKLLRVDQQSDELPPPVGNRQDVGGSFGEIKHLQ